MRWFLLNTPAVILNLFELFCVCSVSLWLRFGKKKDDRSKEAAKGSKVKLEALNEEEQERIPDSRDGWGTHSLFPNKRRLCGFFCFLFLSDDGEAAWLTALARPAGRELTTAHFAVVNSWASEEEVEEKKKSSASLKWFSSFQCVTQDFFFSLLTQHDFSFWFFFWPKWSLFRFYLIFLLLTLPAVYLEYNEKCCPCLRK